jgi:hypothetical protein
MSPANINTEREEKETCKMDRIPFNKPPFFQHTFTAAVHAAVSYGKFSGDGINTKKCT